MLCRTINIIKYLVQGLLLPVYLFLCNVLINVKVVSIAKKQSKGTIISICHDFSQSNGKMYNANFITTDTCGFFWLIRL